MKILVTGATGFLGRHLVRRLIKEGYKVRILKEKSDSLNSLKGVKTEVFIGDIRNFSEVKKAVNGCEVVFHLVGIIAYWNRLNQLQYDINVVGVRNLVKACLEYKVQRLIHVSSNVTIGTREDGELADEKNLYNLWNLDINYCNTKFLGEAEVYKGISRGLDAVIICPASMYGEGDIRKFKTDMTFNFNFPINLLYPGGGIAVVDVEDVAQGLIKAWQKGRKGEKYLLIGENLSFYDIRKTIAEELGKRPPFIRIPNWGFTLLAYIFLWISRITNKRPKLTPEMARFNKIKFYFSNKKAKRELGLTFRPFKESIKKAIRWYKDNKYL